MLRRYDGFLAYREKVHSLAPDLPVFIADCAWIMEPATSYWVKCHTAGDISCHNNYPVLYRQRRVRSIGAEPNAIPQTTALAVAINMERKPVWLVLAANETPGIQNQFAVRFASPIQMRAMVYTAIIHGATGIHYFILDSAISRNGGQIGFSPDPQVVYGQAKWSGNDRSVPASPMQMVQRREGTPMGSLLTLVNRLANALADEFPDRFVGTLAYWHTQKPPGTIRPAKNVMIKFAATEPNRTTAMSTNTGDHWTVAAYSNLKSWAEICRDGNLFIWDYVVMFHNLVSPFPNLRSLEPNMRLFRDLGATGMMAQGNRSAGGEFAELKVYLLAKLIWDPDRDAAKIIDEFLRAYYGPAAAPIRQYIELMHDAGQNQRVGVMEKTRDCKGTFLAPDIVARYDVLFDRAQELVADDERLLHRVEKAYLPVMFARLHLGYGTIEDRLALVERFYRIASRAGIKRLREGGWSPEQFKGEILKALENERKTNR